MEYPNPSQHPNFRDRIATLDQEGRRRWLYPKKLPFSGHFRRRGLIAATLITLLFACPFLELGGTPPFLLSLDHRFVVLFGMAFWPSDFYLVLLLLLIFGVGLIAATAVYGRLWCGWLCPQTIFMEFVFRRLEYWLEGDHFAQRRRAEARWTAGTWLRKGVKQLVFLTCSFALAFAVTANVTGPVIALDLLKRPLVHPLSSGLWGFLGLLFYWIYASFREQICVLVCPYGRLQSVLVDEQTIGVSYDQRRGEPRGKGSSTDRGSGLGDCIDCGECVAVCPTGIDIRDGVQLECVHCTACIDACNRIMAKVQKPSGLIRYASHQGMSKGREQLLTVRSAAYLAVLSIFIAAFTFLYSERTAVEAIITRMPGTLAMMMPDGRLANIYRVAYINKSGRVRTVALRSDLPGAELSGLSTITLPPRGELAGTMVLALSENSISGAGKIDFSLAIDGQIAGSISSVFAKQEAGK